MGVRSSLPRTHGYRAGRGGQGLETSFQKTPYKQGETHRREGRERSPQVCWSCSQATRRAARCPKPTTCTCLRPSGRTGAVSTEVAPKERKARGGSSACPPRGYCLGWGRGGTARRSPSLGGKAGAWATDKHPPHASVRLLRDRRQNKKKQCRLYVYMYIFI